MIKNFLTLLVLFVVLVGPSVPAMETDQYNLPPVPLIDLAPDVEAYVAKDIETAIGKVNAKIEAHEACLSKREAPTGRTVSGLNIRCGTESRERADLAALRSADTIARAVYEELGTGTVFFTSTGNWLNTHEFAHTPVRYKPLYKESIYWTYPVNYATLSPTIRVYGVEFGTDKVDHFFQQGYKYFTTYAAAAASGSNPKHAAAKAVAWGRMTENTFFGYMVSGVYSNADLFANYAGMRFYQALTSDVKIGDTTVPATLKLIDGRWTIDPARKAELVRPFIEDQMNEALNPSNYLFWLYPIVKNVVVKRACPEWHAAMPAATHDDLARRTAALETWNGEDYGFRRTTRQVRLADVCFDGNPIPEAK